MRVFDPDFETLRLSMLAEQYADQRQEAGEILFKAEHDENYVSHARGKVQMASGQLTIEWLPEGSTELSS